MSMYTHIARTNIRFVTLSEIVMQGEKREVGGRREKGMDMGGRREKGIGTRL